MTAAPTPGGRDFDGLVAVITGGASGIGAACAEELRRRGGSVTVLDRDPSADVVADVSQPLEPAMAAVAATKGGIDILVNSAAIGAVGTVEDNGDEEWLKVLDINVVGVARACRAAMPFLRRSRNGVIVNITSIAAGAGLANRALYSASKGAVHALTLAMANDLVSSGIRVCCVAPGTVDTPWVARLLATADDPTEEKRRLAARQPTGRLVTADQVAAAVAYLASPASGATTATSLAVDGGMSGLRIVR